MRPRLRIAGLSGEYTRETTRTTSSKQWDEFNAQLAASAEYRAVDATYGVVYPLATMRYVSGIELAGGADGARKAWVEVTVPAQRVCGVRGDGGIEAIRAAWPAIFWGMAAGSRATS